ncbi:UBA/TS-N domain-containing protein [Cryptosporidium muris RN66]|uniref:UBA/TS-N domain-containing protein n=1 Tax=Cryptosporidium muris (strain RN66) TaxID=441375 RepID=B6AGC2_CRYMR|nr:UBA/TS-N domain-containing protein [Cryptosporidium muris RN66]EEA07263.1 UBA/TS-N domain-containing protein [Cryptosporidium muris RN66]|eukprot:XP_002141612.1 UBA/TS-N domain-containing protein [Cryptosporidium muris RN66]
MLINILNNISGAIVSLDLSSDTTIGILKSLVACELKISASSLQIIYNGRNLTNEQYTLENYSIESGDILVVNSTGEFLGETQSNTSQVSHETLASNLLDHARLDESIARTLINANPEFQSAIETNNTEGFLILLQNEFQKRVQPLNSNSSIINTPLDPLSPEFQRLVEEEVRMRNVNETLEMAQEHLPESFAQVHMLYVNIEVNGILIRAFVDSGAQTTIMSKKCAEKCNLVRLIDNRFQGIAHGIGTSKILGKIHMAQMKVGQTFFSVSFTILEGGIDFLFGLDLLRRHQCCIDLKKGILSIGNEQVPFLSESETKDIDIFSRNRLQTNIQEINSPLEDEKLQQLMSLGFSEEESKVALQECNGNANLAASKLLFKH